MKPMMFIRNLAKTFFPAFSIGTGFCLVQMIISDRPILSAGLMLVCIGMTLLCANLEVWAMARLARMANEEATEGSELKEVS